MTLLRAAACSWVTAWFLLAGSASVATVTAIIGTVAAVLALAARIGWLAIVAACVTVVAIATVARLDQRQSGPVHGAGIQRSVATVEGVVASDPRTVAGRVRGIQRSDDSIVIDISVRRFAVGAQTYAVRGVVRVSATGRGWRTLQPSQRIAFSGRAGIPRHNDPVVASFKGFGEPTVLSRPSRLQRIAHRLRSGLSASTTGLADGPGGLLPGLVDGDTSRLDAQVGEDFRATSLTHLTAVSGSNVAIVLATVLGIVGLLGAGPKTRAFVAVFGLVGFVVVARPSPSVLRAAAMGVVVLLALLVGRPKRSLPALGAAVVVLLAHDPDLARSVGFALSSIATAGIVVLGPRIEARLPTTWPPIVRTALSIPLAAQLACAPVIGATFGVVGLVAIPANLLAAPVVVPATLAGVAAAGLSTVWMPLARAAAEVGGYACGWLVTVAHRLAEVRGASIALPRGWIGACLALLITLLCAALLLGSAPRRALLAALVGCAFAGVLVTPHVVESWPPRGWALVTCDVGQGDAMVLRGDQDGDVLIDAGPDPRRLADCLARLKVRRLQRVILTHLHADHVEGLPAVLGRLPVGVIEIGPLREPVDEWERVQRWARSAGVAIHEARVGDRGRAGDAQWEVLGPSQVLHGTDSDPNNASLVLALRTGSISVLLTGDAEGLSQSALLNTVGAGAIEADVLKIPHHGSAKQDNRFLDEVRARITVTSVGVDNPYGHPSPTTLQRVANGGAAVLRTDLDGSIALLRREGQVLAVPSKRRAGRAGAAPDIGSPPPARALAALGLRSVDRFWCT